MSLQFHRAVESLDVWSATSGAFSFVISYESPTGSGFRGRLGYLASWRPVYSEIGAVKVAGSPFSSFEDAEKACNAMLDELRETPMKMAVKAAARATRILIG